MNHPIVLTLIPNDITPLHLKGTWTNAPMTVLHGHTMGTYWTFRWQEPDPQDHVIPPNVIQQTLAKAFQRVIEQMSHYDPNSELSRINQSLPHQPHRLSPDFFLVLQEALRLSQLTDGAYHPNLAALSSHYGFGPDSHITSAAPLPLEINRQPWKDIHLDPSTETLTHGNQRLHLDLSSIAKGHALDLAARSLEQELHLQHFLLEIGGEFLARGCKPDAQPWWVEIETPDTVNRLRFALTHHSLATSGPGDRQIHHLLDPFHQRPTKHQDLISVTVLAATCMKADAWATALYILGLEQGLQFASEHQIHAVFTCREQHHFSPFAKTLLGED